jgi:hypothetical protein
LTRTIKIAIFVLVIKPIQTMTLQETPLRKGSKVWRLLNRNNPQLTDYSCLIQTEVKSVGKKTINTDFGRYDQITGERVDGYKTSYGTSQYQLLSDSDAYALAQKDSSIKVSSEYWDLPEGRIAVNQ